MENTEDIFALPFDQYSRQRWASTIIDTLRPKNKGLKILDVGGYKGKTSLFQNRDEVFICDLFEVDEPNYIQGDGKTLPFEDGKFDVVLTFDTYEHVTRKNRKKFIDELARVSKLGVVLAAPFDNDHSSVSRAEKDLNEYYRFLYGKDHRWLKEHIDYKIPTRSEIENILSAGNLKYTSLPSNELDVWVTMQTIYFSIELDADLRGRVDDINRAYNKNLVDLDYASEDNAYRHIYFFSKNEDHVSTVRRALGDSKANKSPKEKSRFMALALRVYGLKYRDVQNYKKYLEEEVGYLLDEREHLHKHRIGHVVKQTANRLVGSKQTKKVIGKDRAQS